MARFKFYIAFFCFTLPWTATPTKVFATETGKPNRINDLAIQIGSTTLSLRSILTEQDNAENYEDWIAIHTIKNGWGPHGGNIFIKISSTSVNLDEIETPWSSTKKLLFKITEKFPGELLPNKSYSFSYRSYAYSNEKLWFTAWWTPKDLELGDCAYPPQTISFADFKEKNFHFFPSRTFPSGKIPFVKKIYPLKTGALLIGVYTKCLEEMPSLNKFIQDPGLAIFQLQTETNAVQQIIPQIQK